MDKKPSDEFIVSQIHVFLFIIIPVVTPFECDYAVFKLQYTVVGNGNTMGISSEIFNYTAGIFEWRLAINNPFFLFK